MKDNEKRAIAQEIMEIITAPTLAENEITASMYAEANGITKRQADSVLKRAVANQQITRRDEKVLYQGNWQWAYSRKPPGP